MTFPRPSSPDLAREARDGDAPLVTRAGARESGRVVLAAASKPKTVECTA
ncbi:hypothetical protein ACFWNN_23795 [Lentzea sp. NPDC058450]